MSQIFFTSDTHFGHHNILIHCRRPFETAAAMDAAMIERWNAVVKSSDTVYHLGDFAWMKSAAEVAKLVRVLNGQIHLIYGNHDRDAVRRATGFAWKGDYKYIHVGELTVVMFHFPLRTWHKSHYGAWHLHGHHHGGLDPIEGTPSLDVGVDAWNFTPVSFEQIASEIGRRTDGLPNPLLLAQKGPQDD